MRKDFPLIFGLLIAVFLLSFYFDNAKELFSKSYVVKESNLYRIDTFHLFRRAFTSADGAGRHAETKLIFESIERHSFAISRNFYQAITNRQRLEDTLMYHDMKFTIYSTKDVYEKYRISMSPIFIPVYQILIGETKYIDISAANRITKEKLMRRVMLPPVVISFIFLALFIRITWTDKKRLAFAVIFILTIFGCLLLT